MQARRRAGLRSFPWQPLAGSACRASGRRSPCADARSPSPNPSAALPGLTSDHHTPGASGSTSLRSRRSSGSHRARSGLATSKRRPGAAWQQSLQACVASLALQSSSGLKPYFESDHFRGGGSLGLIGEGVDHRTLVRDAVLFGARNRDGWGIGLTILTALAKLIPSLPEEETYLALYKGMSRVARDCDGASSRRDRQPLAPREYQPLPVLERWFRHWARVRHRDAAERTLLTAIASGASSIDLAALMLIAVTDRYFSDGGHALDFTNKAFESLDIIGWEHAPAILPSVVDQMVRARGSEESNAWRQPIDLVPLCEAAFVELPELLSDGRAKRGSWRGDEVLARRLLGDDPAAIVVGLKSAIRDGATAADLSRAIAYAAALRVALFGTANEHSDWDTALHCFTYCNAVHQLLTRITAEMPMELERPELLRGVFHGAMQVYLIRFLNVPPPRLPGEGDDQLDDLPREGGELRDAFLNALDRQGAVKTAGRLVARYLILGHPVEPLVATLTRAVLREDAEFHTYQMLEAGVRQYRQWGESAAGRHILTAVARYIAAHSPTERAQLQTATVARRLSRGESVYEAEDV